MTLGYFHLNSGLLLGHSGVWGLLSVLDGGPGFRFQGWVSCFIVSFTAEAAYSCNFPKTWANNSPNRIYGYSILGIVPMFFVNTSCPSLDPHGKEAKRARNESALWTPRPSKRPHRSSKRPYLDPPMYLC